LGFRLIWCLLFVWVLLAAYRAAATYFPLLAQRKVSKGKSTLLPPTLRSAPGHPQTRLLRRLKQRVWLLPSGAVRGRRCGIKNALQVPMLL